MLRSVIIDIPNSKISHNSSDIIVYIASILDVRESDIIRWAIIATHDTQSFVIVSYVK